MKGLLGFLFCFLFSALGEPLANRNLGMYVLLADDTTPYNSTKVWQPQLHRYQQQGTNLLFFTFINPSDLPNVPPAFSKLAKTRGSQAPGAVPGNTTILFSIGGEAYSQQPNPWAFLETKEAAEAMAVEIAKWPAAFGCDGIDMDLETGAGTSTNAVKNIPYFAAKLKEVNPDFIFSQPVFGSPSSVPAANAVLEASYNKSHAVSPSSVGSVQRVGIMVYSSDSALQYVANYAQGCTKCTQWYCPLACCVPMQQIFLGADGGSDAQTITKLANDVINNQLAGIMVWFASVLDSGTGQTALVYGPAGDASDPSHAASQAAWQSALKMLQQ
mmetsp:Transcript_50757/g.99466  ORF Transcript_50757/g.99466 Transcript_50757/m.99466 type:complete len:329 (+) Transcript_50757:49-1035(+)|eukprot:CAMPEP_0175139066 /NCGR_PEP_ID=MMETSP0087-20121206/10690_1 /TAXON_ID=136419 /ORGANISM="Unknown Unknown, Strain D1" /LENGTH=328 /DNA_ID=CAMNT_0016422023 /DNA_START=48 /DNA_END=1034 /DNA_ORIENTATION=-